MKPIFLSLLIAIFMSTTAYAEDPASGTPTASPTLGPSIIDDKPEPEAPAEEKVLAELYVTDKLVLGMKDNPEGKGKSIKLLRSGMKLEVLAKEGLYNKVRTDDGMVGWAKSNFMVRDKPAILVVDELKRENGALRNEIEKLKADGVATKAETKTVAVEEPGNDDVVKQRLMELETSLDEARNQLAEKESELEDARAGLPLAQDASLPIIASLIALFLGLAIGSVLVYMYFEKRINQRFAGLRV
jgi:SH3 domain protein